MATGCTFHRFLAVKQQSAYVCLRVCVCLFVQERGRVTSRKLKKYKEDTLHNTPFYAGFVEAEMQCQSRYLETKSKKKNECARLEK